MVNAEDESNVPSASSPESSGETKPPSSSHVSDSDSTVNKALEWMHELPSTCVMFVSRHFV